jgi:hypothetical protein
MFVAPAKAAVTFSSRNLYHSSHDAARAPVYRTSNYEHSHSEKDHDQTNAVPAITGSEVIPRVKPKLFRGRKEFGICHRSAAFCHNSGYLSLANLRRRRCAEPISSARAELTCRVRSLAKISEILPALFLAPASRLGCRLDFRSPLDRSIVAARLELPRPSQAGCSQPWRASLRSRRGRQFLSLS